MKKPRRRAKTAQSRKSPGAGSSNTSPEPPFASPSVSPAAVRDGVSSAHQHSELRLSDSEKNDAVWDEVFASCTDIAKDLARKHRFHSADCDEVLGNLFLAATKGVAQKKVSPTELVANEAARLKAIGKNKAVDVIRDRSKHRRRHRGLSDAAAIVSGQDVADESLRQLLADSRRLEVLIKRLSERDRIIVRAMKNGESLDVTAAALGVSKPTLSVARTRAVARLMDLHLAAEADGSDLE